MDSNQAVLSLSETLSKGARSKSELRGMLANQRDLYQRENDQGPTDALDRHIAMLDDSSTIEDYLQKARLDSTDAEGAATH